ncbi:AMP-binding protein [Aeromicrobium sp.]|uniref:AMP-binding protein n=1 Tax=Aeromicrobium sp. TaxID=1871063 RepID=UPI002FCBC867
MSPVPFADLRRWGSRPALIAADDSLTYAELADRIESMPWQDERRLVLVPGANTLETLAAYVSAIANGHVVLLVPGDSPAVFESLIDAYDPDLVFDAVAGGFVERHEGTRHDLHPDLALLMTTSGSTGSPKLVRLSRDNVLSNAGAIAGYLGLTAADRAITTLPMHYCYGLSVIHSHLIAGAGVVVTDWSVLDPCLWDLADREQVTSFAGVPYTFDLLDSSGFAERELPSLRYVTQAGGRLAPERVAGYARLGRERGWDFIAMYGQTEATARMAYLPPKLAESHPHALGVPIPGGSFQIDPVAGEQRPGVGELVYRGDNVMMGYASSAADLARGRDVSELRTGDLVRRDDDGLLEWVGRRSRFAKAYGVRIDLDDLEAVVARHGGAARCVSTGDRLHVFIDWHQDAADLHGLVARTAGLPAHAVSVTRLRWVPRNASGKTDYPALERHAVMTDASRDEPAEPDNQVSVERVRDLYAQLLGRPGATADDSFASLGGDSLSYVELSVRLSALRLDLPGDWHTRPIRELVSAPGRRRGMGVRLEMSILLRALAIMLVLGTHANLFVIPGGAHLLLAVCGYNFVRFQLSGESARVRARLGLRSLAHLVIPSVIWIGAVAVVLRTYDLSTVLLLNGALGSDSWTDQWQFWFLEAVLWTQVVALGLLSLPILHRSWRRHPFGFALAFTLVALATRYALVGVEAGPTERYTPSIVLWCFALGWLVAAARTPWQRLAASAVAVGGVAGFFGDPQREAVVAGGMLLLVWIAAVPVPRLVARVVGSLAAASLYIYLTHWQVYPHLEMKVPILAVLSSLVVGLAYRQVVVTIAARLALVRWVPARSRAPLPRRTVAVLERV